MRAVGIKVLKNRLSEYVRLAATGEVVLVTDRDRVVAELGPPRLPPDSPISDNLMAEGVRQGWIRPALVTSAAPPQRAPVAKLAEIMAELAHDREDR
jgi:antitoxin (DNA-binding transcriptional repressor) of toxin-antitoxin stability system